MTVAYNDMEAIMKATPVMPVIVIEDADKAVDLAQALAAGGVTTLEITLRTEAALKAIENIAANVSGVTVGAGTVITPEDVQKTVDAGGSFCVSPGATPALLEAVEKQKSKVLPGAVTASEVMTLMQLGVTYMKFFPAEPMGGAGALKALAGPLPQAKFCPTGGVKLNNAQAYLDLPNVLCVGGSWLVPKDAVANGNWNKIKELAQQATFILNSK